MEKKTVYYRYCMHFCKFFALSERAVILHTLILVSEDKSEVGCMAKLCCKKRVKTYASKSILPGICNEFSFCSPLNVLVSLSIQNQVQLELKVVGAWLQVISLIFHFRKILFSTKLWKTWFRQIQTGAKRETVHSGSEESESEDAKIPDMLDITALFGLDQTNGQK